MAMRKFQEAKDRGSRPYPSAMAHTAWTLPPSIPIVDHRPTRAQIAGLLLAGLIVGVIGALLAVNYADSQRRPDPLNETGPWVALMPRPADGADTSLMMALDASTLTTGCGEWRIGYTQNGTDLLFENLPPAPRSCSPDAAEAHTWFVSQLANTRSFAPAELGDTPDTSTITLSDADGQALVAIAIEPRLQR
jgi:hypothetical protein